MRGTNISRTMRGSNCHGDSLIGGICNVSHWMLQHFDISQFLYTDVSKVNFTYHLFKSGLKEQFFLEWEPSINYVRT